MEDRYALVRAGTVENVFLWDGSAGWTPPEGAEPIRLDMLRADHRSAAPGDSYDGANFTKAASPEPVELRRFAEIDVRDYTEALLTAFVQEGVIPSVAKAQAIAQRMRQTLRR